jgi:G:T-mismatch repair DNA endonuclease (very short patch repair protein)
MGVPHVERNISRDREAKQEFRDKGYEFLPIIEVGDSVITDYMGEPQLIEVLVEEGYL